MSNRSSPVLPLAPIEKLIRTGSGAPRVSASATEAMEKVLSEIGFKISERAAHLSKHAGRKTIKEEDIKLAAKDV
ncbi:histone [archaeon CG10_big_fil_rev_8_21_14_0_10_43_11]|nr:MAG: histone [archaeon CG10_big_fil_rev_8_21_14_0_10_43_11]